MTIIAIVNRTYTGLGMSLGRALVFVTMLLVCTSLLAGRPVAAQSGGVNASIARMELRIAELERQLRTMTGQVERLTFDLKQANGRLERALSDTEYRLSLLEGNAPSTGEALAGETPAGEAPAVPSAGEVPAPASNTAASPIQTPRDAQEPGGGQAGDSQILGTLRSSTTTDDGPTGTVTTASPGPGGDVAGQYNAAFALLQQRDFPEAEVAFRDFVQAHGDHALASNAQYWIGESYYAQGQFKEAAASFALGYQQYPDGAKALDSLVKLGMTFGAMGQRGDACSTFGQISREFPAAPQGIKRRVSQELDRLQCG